MKLRIAGIANDSIVDGPGLRLTIFAQGCPHFCPGCHNPKTHDVLGGYEIDVEEIINMAEKNPLLSGLTLSGGEPFMQAAAMSVLAGKARRRGLNIIIYTGYSWEELNENKDFAPLIQEVDYIVDGRFVESLRTLEMPFVGSSNQRIIDVKKSLAAQEIVLHSF